MVRRTRKRQKGGGLVRMLAQRMQEIQKNPKKQLAKNPQKEVKTTKQLLTRGIYEYARNPIFQYMYKRCKR